MPKFVIERDPRCPEAVATGAAGHLAEEAVREHARQAGFPANQVSRVRSVIDPTTAE
jgi:hypothetical protein